MCTGILGDWGLREVSPWPQLILLLTIYMHLTLKSSLQKKLKLSTEAVERLNVIIDRNTPRILKLCLQFLNAIWNIKTQAKYMVSLGSVGDDLQDYTCTCMFTTGNSSSHIYYNLNLLQFTEIKHFLWLMFSFLLLGLCKICEMNPQLTLMNWQLKLCLMTCTWLLTFNA